MSLFAKYYGTGKTKHRKAKYQAVHVMTCILRFFAKHSTVVYTAPSRVIPAVISMSGVGGKGYYGLIIEAKGRIE